MKFSAGRIRCLLVLATFGHVFFSLPARADGGLNSLFRAVTGVIGTSQQAPAVSNGKGVTATLGVRGIDDETPAATGPAATKDYTMMEGWAASDTEAARAAEQRQLVARNVSLRPVNAAAGGSQ